ncbi:hypothetical protein FOCC_FOCC006404 [Frankliniella occidentalis]|nr:hypothetical protein FOCC_FOCC006404 [Frankliniella occidentalis]
MTAAALRLRTARIEIDTSNPHTTSGAPPPPQRPDPAGERALVARPARLRRCALRLTMDNRSATVPSDSAVSSVITMSAAAAPADTVTCHKCKAITLHKSSAAAVQERSLHAKGQCNSVASKKADHDRYAAEERRCLEAQSVACAVREYLAPTCIAIAECDKLVVCKPCKMVLQYSEKDFQEAVSFHKHAPNGPTHGPAPITSSATNKLWLQAKDNWENRVYFSITCGHCRLQLSYNRTDINPALAHHYGKLCTQPSPLWKPPTPTTEDDISAASARAWATMMDEAVTAALGAIAPGGTVEDDDQMDIAVSPSATGKKRHRMKGSSPPPTPTKNLRAHNAAHPPTADSDSSDAEDSPAQPDEVSAPHSVTHKGKPPPILVDGDWGLAFHHKMQTYAHGLTKQFTARLTGGQKDPKLLLRTHTLADYDKLLQTLRAAREPFTTSTPRGNRQERLVACRVPPGIPAEWVKTEVQRLGFPIIHAHRIVVPDRNGGGRALDKVLCTFPPGTALKEVAEKANTLQGCQVRWQRYDNAGEPLQCFRCQGFNHATKNCNRPTQCRKCSREHSASDCPGRETRCANCGEAHRSTYRGCTHYQHFKEQIALRKTGLQLLVRVLAMQVPPSILTIPSTWTMPHGSSGSSEKVCQLDADTYFMTAPRCRWSGDNDLRRETSLRFCKHVRRGTQDPVDSTVEWGEPFSKVAHARMVWHNKYPLTCFDDTPPPGPACRKH